jgi:hypothetical protein
VASGKPLVSRHCAVRDEGKNLTPQEINLALLPSTLSHGRGAWSVRPLLICRNEVQLRIRISSRLKDQKRAANDRVGKLYLHAGALFPSRHLRRVYTIPRAHHRFEKRQPTDTCFRSTWRCSPASCTASTFAPRLTVAWPATVSFSVDWSSNVIATWPSSPDVVCS